MKKINKGSMFSIKIDNKFYCGQIIEINKPTIAVIIFLEEIKDKKECDPTKLTPLLISNTFPLKFNTGDWQICCVKKPIIEYKPVYKINKNEELLLVDIKGNKLKKLKSKEADKYLFERYDTPALIEKIIKKSMNEEELTDSEKKLLFSKYQSI